VSELDAWRAWAKPFIEGVHFIGPCSHGRDPHTRCDEPECATEAGAAAAVARKASARVLELERDLEQLAAVNRQTVAMLDLLRKRLHQLEELGPIGSMPPTEQAPAKSLTDDAEFREQLVRAGVLGEMPKRKP